METETSPVLVVLVVVMEAPELEGRRIVEYSSKREQTEQR